MTVSREDLTLPPEEAAGQREWIRPAVQRLAAGSAEDGFGPQPDGGLPS